MTDLSAATTKALEAGNTRQAAHVAAELAKKGESRLPSFFRRKAGA
ncbi:MAG: hypothetical protein KGO53_04030 [Alphaproteobacteria bacterium]|nr:hypothetical protein [Alphaproteobacteria bacterium]